MYFLWKNTSYGVIRVSYDGLYDFMNDAAKFRLKLYSIALSPSKQDADMIIVISEDNLIPDMKTEIENHFASILKPMGINASIVWAVPERNILSLLQNPYLWAVAASCTAIIITAGFEGFFWTVFCAASAWFVVRGLGIIAKRFRSA